MRMPGKGLAIILASAFAAILLVPCPVRAEDAVGTLDVDCSGGEAFIELDGKWHGVTPLRIDGLEPGPHNLKLTMEGYTDYSGEVVISENQKTYFIWEPVPLIIAERRNKAEFKKKAGTVSLIAGSVLLAGSAAFGVDAIVTLNDYNSNRERYMSYLKSSNYLEQRKLDDYKGRARKSAIRYRTDVAVAGAMLAPALAGIGFYVYTRLTADDSGAARAGASLHITGASICLNF
jgi:hypothetical protein